MDALLLYLLILALRFLRVIGLGLVQAFDFEVDLVATSLWGQFVMFGNFEDPALWFELLASSHVRALRINLPCIACVSLLLLEGALINIVRSWPLAHCCSIDII